MAGIFIGFIFALAGKLNEHHAPLPGSDSPAVQVAPATEPKSYESP